VSFDLHSEVGGLVDAETLDRGVLDVQALDGRVLKRVGIEEPITVVSRQDFLFDR
jgi:hypothetical protein